jgi:predicted DNA-binding transcriptional regulator AlpA
MSKSQTELLARITRLEKLIAALPPPPRKRHERESERRIGKLEVAERLGVHTATIERRLADRKKYPDFPPSKMIAGRHTWTVGEIDEYIAAQPEGGVAETEAA